LVYSRSLGMPYIFLALCLSLLPSSFEPVKPYELIIIPTIDVDTFIQTLDLEIVVLTQFYFKDIITLINYKFSV
jgi:hypothetical protein